MNTLVLPSRTREKLGGGTPLHKHIYPCAHEYHVFC